MTKQEDFFYAIQNNDLENLKLLIKDKEVNPSVYSNYALRKFSKSGNFDIVKLLIEYGRVDITYDKNYPLRIAYQNDHIKVAHLLFKQPSVKKTLKVNQPTLFNQLKKEVLKNKIVSF